MGRPLFFCHIPKTAGTSLRVALEGARELQPQGIHVAHVVIDGGIKSTRRAEPPDNPDSLLDPAAIAENYLHLLRQPRNAWSWEIEVRPWVEKF